MKQREFTVIDALNVVNDLNRAGRKAGQTNVAKLGGVTPKRAKKVLASALHLGLLFVYRDRYRSNVTRRCFSASVVGMEVIDILASQRNSMNWVMSDES
jgi:hypothetical protein